MLLEAVLHSAAPGGEQALAEVWTGCLMEGNGGNNNYRDMTSELTLHMRKAC